MQMHCPQRNNLHALLLLAGSLATARCFSTMTIKKRSNTITSTNPVQSHSQSNQLRPLCFHPYLVHPMTTATTTSSTSSSTTHLGMVRVDTSGTSTKHRRPTTASPPWQQFLLKLGRGIFFAKPAGPTVSQALFGLSIRSRRKNDKDNNPQQQQQQQKDIHTFSFTLREALLAIAVYLGIGVTAYSLLMENWTWIDSLYFSMVVFTTVGFGDLVPSADKPLVKIFTCAFSLGGVAFLAAALACLGAHVVETEAKAAHSAKRVTKKRLLPRLQKLWSRRPGSPPPPPPSPNIDPAQYVTAVVPFIPKQKQIDDHQAKPPPKVTIFDLVRRIVPRMGFLVSLGLVFGWMEHWSWVDSVYFSLSTASTVGFGDKAPTLQSTRLLAVFCIPIMVAMGGEILGTIASAFLQRRRAALFDNLVKKDFSIEHIKEMDSDGDGQVSKLDYINFMLVEMEFVERAVLEELESQFDRLDMTKGGTLSKKDLILMAKMRRRMIDENGGVDGDKDDNFLNGQEKAIAVDGDVVDVLDVAVN